MSLSIKLPETNAYKRDFDETKYMFLTASLYTIKSI